MRGPALDELKQQIPLMGYLQAQDWKPTRSLHRGRGMGRCPLHEDHNPSFLVDPHKNLFYCYGCGRGGDVLAVTGWPGDARQGGTIRRAQAIAARA